MKNTMLCSAFLALLCSQGHAEDAQQNPNDPFTSVTQNQSDTPSAADQSTQRTQLTEPLQYAAADSEQLAEHQPIQPIDASQAEQQPTILHQQQLAIAQEQTSTQQQPIQNIPSIQPTQQTPSEQQQKIPAINCDFKIPAETKKLDQALVLNWSEKATLQSFDFSPTLVDTQIQKLQPCFTEQGWIGFNSALQKSGNIEAIKTQQLTVSSQIDGQTQITDLQNNKWQVNLPLQVVYQNDKEKVTQLLSINLTVGRKTTGDLGIIQIIATPRGTVTTKKIPTSQPNTLSPSSSDVNKSTNYDTTSIPNNSTPADNTHVSKETPEQLNPNQNNSSTDSKSTNPNL